MHFRHLPVHQSNNFLPKAHYSHKEHVPRQIFDFLLFSNLFLLVRRAKKKISRFETPSSQDKLSSFELYAMSCSGFISVPAIFIVTAYLHFLSFWFNYKKAK